MRRTTSGDRSSGRPSLSLGWRMRVGPHATSCYGERTPYKELTLSQVLYEHGLKLMAVSLYACSEAVTCS